MFVSGVAPPPPPAQTPHALVCVSPNAFVCVTSTLVANCHSKPVVSVKSQQKIMKKSKKSQEKCKFLFFVETQVSFRKIVHRPSDSEFPLFLLLWAAGTITDTNTTTQRFVDHGRSWWTPFLSPGHFCNL